MRRNWAADRHRRMDLSPRVMPVPRHPLLDFVTPCRTKLERGDPALGLFILSASPMVTELCATLALDWILVDAEASPVSKESVLHLFQAMLGSGIAPMIRVQEMNHHLIEHALDLGAHGILVPKIHDAEMARAAVAACYFPPRGRRGINPVRCSGYFANVPEYIRRANDRTLCMVQIESREALANVREIAHVDGVNILFVGPGDLAASLGQPTVVEGPVIEAAYQCVLDAAREAGKTAGIFAYGTEMARRWLARGFRFVALGNDLKILREGVQRTLADVQETRPAPSADPLRTKALVLAKGL